MNQNLWKICLLIFSCFEHLIESRGDSLGALLPAPYRNSEYFDYNSISIHFPEFISSNGLVDAYELSFRSTFDSSWTIYGDLGSFAENRTEAQIISVRVDQGKKITKGTFTLGMVYNNLNPNDFEQAARTPPIPFDATAAQLKTALSALAGISVKTAVRCDQFGNLTQSFGGFDGWFYDCPYHSQGGYRWLVVLETLAREPNFPLLYPFRENLGKTWTSNTEQVSVTRIRHGISSSFCTYGICSLVAKHLEEGTPYVFRYRAHVSTNGWTEYSETSHPLMTLAKRIPPKPRVPMAQSSRLTSITFLIQSFPRLLGVFKFDSQYRAVGDTSWKAGPLLLLDEDAGRVLSENPSLGANNELDSKIYSLIFEHLLPATAYEVRVRAWNSLGVGPFSSHSSAYSTQEDEFSRPSVIPPQVIEAEVTDTSIGVTLHAAPDSAGALSTESYLLQYKPSSTSTATTATARWLNHTETFQFTVRREGVEVQEIEIRSDSKNGCDGYFWIQLPGMLPSLIETTVTTAIPFAATEEEFNAAILSIPRISKSNAQVTTQRRLNQFNGYVWTINIEGMGNIARFTPSRNNLTSGGGTGTGRECWTGAGSVISTRTLKDGDELLSNVTQHVTITGLKQQSRYDLRLMRIDSRFSSERSYSEVISVTTIPSSKGWTSNEDSNGNGNALDSSSPTLPGSYAEAAHWNRAARTLDFNYAMGSSNGGATGERGEDGSCVLSLYRPDLFQAFSTKYFFYSGKEEEFVIPEISSEDSPVRRLTVKCWGGGGGGGLLPFLDSGDQQSIAPGGGGAFAQASLAVSSGDRLKIIVGGGGMPPQAEVGGKGGYGGGGDGGNGIRGGGGGGGGGASIVRYLSSSLSTSEASSGASTGEILLVAAGGGGAGSTTYCCAGGGGGGVSIGGQGTSSGDNTPWPLSDPDDGRPTPIRRRWEYTSRNCSETSGDPKDSAWCTSPWDVEERSLPADHLDVDYGEKPDANYSIWSEGGRGGELLRGGMFGVSGGYEVTSIPEERLVSFAGGGVVYGLNQKSAVNPIAQPGGSLRGGRGGGGKKGGGGGGGGLYGGGGGGSGIDGAGGGGGSSYVNTALTVNSQNASSASTSGSMSVSTAAPVLVFLTHERAEFAWRGDWLDARGRFVKEYAVELSQGNYSQDFKLVTTAKLIFVDNTATAITVDTTNGNTATVPTVGTGTETETSNQAFSRVFSCSITSLSSEEMYSLRILPLLSSGYGPPSAIIKFKTLAIAQNYWEPVLTHRLATAGTGRGLNPVLSRPHLDEGVEIYGERTSVNPLRVTDPPTATTPAIPSSRRGHSLSLVQEFVYMFGGTTDGYTCAFSYKDTINLGSPSGGVDIEPCATSRNEVDELWSWNIYSYTWKYEHVVSSNNPARREMHSAGVLDGNLFIFGGRSRGTYPSTDNTVYADFWRLNIEPFLSFNHTYLPSSAVSGGEAIAEGVRNRYPLSLLSDSNGNPSADPYQQVGGDNDVFSSRYGPCLRDLVIEVEVSHPCVNQLRLSLQGPGPSTGSPNFHPHSFDYEVLLFDSTHRVNTTACARGTFQFLFSDSDTDESSGSGSGSSGSGSGSAEATTSCCHTAGRHRFRPDGRLSEYLGGTPFANWTLLVEDMEIDGQAGQLLSWQIRYITEPCNRQYSWTLVSPTNPPQDLPPARYSSNMIVYEQSIFLFGGRGSGDQILTDLYRYDLHSNRWATLFPMNFNIPFGTASMVGMNLALSRWGLIRFGGYIRLPSLAGGKSKGTYVNDVFLMDPVTLQWTVVAIEQSSQYPAGRYLSGSVFLPSSAFQWKTQFSYRALFDERLTSTGANFGSSLIDSLLIFGGDNGATGSFVDGSTGGMLNDMWQLRLGNWSLSSERMKQDAYVAKHCQWRKTISGRDPSAKQNLCAPPNAGSVCDLRDMILLAWCGNNDNQTVA